ncbi:hypothetical protein KAR91_50550 [Candidatus Pacearchaeota archaeon]|nr:hypothetical protein [Candidatus Pacearchaeota archaeon]
MSEANKNSFTETLATAAFLFLLVFIFWDFGDEDGTQYLGRWKNENSSETVTITRLPPEFQQQPGKTFKLSDGSVAELVIPIRVEKVSFCWHGRVGGVYEVNNHHSLIIWCDGADHNVVTALSKRGEALHMGLVDRFNSLTEQMCVGHDSHHSRDKTAKWITYIRAPP